MTVRIQEHPTKPQARVLFMEAQVRASDEKPVITFTGSTDTEDRYGTIIDPRGWDTAAYERNPVVLFAHKYDAPPVGKTISLTKTRTALRFKVEFATFDPFGRQIYELVKQGFLSGVSVGFLPQSLEPYESTTVPRGDNVRYTRAELLELSIVPVPANRDALKNAFDGGRLSARTIAVTGLRSFLDGGPALPRAYAALPPKPVGMDEELYRDAVAAGVKPESALKIQEILRRRARSRW